MINNYMDFEYFTSVMNFLQIGLISWLSVALNIITCLHRGVNLNICWISDLIETLSNTLSHSSIMKCFISFKEMAFCLTRSTSLPGVATII